MIIVHAIHNYPPMLRGNVRDIRAIWALEELGLPYRMRWMDFAALEHRAPANRQLSPFGRIPPLEDDDTCVFESGAIVRYLFDKAGKGAGTAAERAAVNAWCFAALNTVEPIFFEAALWDMLWTDREGRARRYPQLQAFASERLDDLERTLHGKSWLVGDIFGPADILMTTALDFCRSYPNLFEPYPGVRAYLARCHDRRAYGRAQALQGVGPSAA